MAEKGVGSAQADAETPSEKHPLQFKWTLWHDPPKNKSISGKNYGDYLRPIASFDTVEDFWAYVFRKSSFSSFIPKQCPVVEVAGVKSIAAVVLLDHDSFFRQCASTA